MPVAPDEGLPTVKRRDLPAPFGLEQPFPGENPDAGAAEGPAASGGAESESGASGDRRTSAGPRVVSEDTALDAAVDEVFFQNRNIDIKDLEKDWVEWSK